MKLPMTPPSLCSGSDDIAPCMGLVPIYACTYLPVSVQKTAYGRASVSRVCTCRCARVVSYFTHSFWYTAPKPTRKTSLCVRLAGHGTGRLGGCGWLTFNRRRDRRRLRNRLRCPHTARPDIAGIIGGVSDAPRALNPIPIFAGAREGDRRQLGQGAERLPSGTFASHVVSAVRSST